MLSNLKYQFRLLMGVLTRYYFNARHCEDSVDCLSSSFVMAGIYMYSTFVCDVKYQSSESAGLADSVSPPDRRCSSQVKSLFRGVTSLYGSQLVCFRQPWWPMRGKELLLAG